jgi:hypothetical protein
MLRSLCALGIGLPEDWRRIKGFKQFLSRCSSEFLMSKDETGRAHEDDDCYEAMKDLSHRRTSDLYG